MGKVLRVTRPCRLQPEELIAYQDGTLAAGRREIVKVHLAACPHCQERLAAFREVDDIIQRHAIPLEAFDQMRAGLHERLRREAVRRQGPSRWLKRMVPPRRPAVARLLVVLLVVLAVLPAATQAEFPLGHFVRFAEVEIKQRLPLDEQRPVRHVAPSDPSAVQPSFQPVAPAELPLGLVRVEQSTPSADRVEALYRNEAGVAILLTEQPAEAGMVTLDAIGTDLVTVRGTAVLVVRDTRPDAVAALVWERGETFFDLKVLEAPTGGNGGFKQADALQVVEALIEAHDTHKE